MWRRKTVKRVYTAQRNNVPTGVKARFCEVHELQHGQRKSSPLQGQSDLRASIRLALLAKRGVLH